MIKYILLSGFVTMSVISIQSCKKDKTDPDADIKLYSESTASGFTNYMNGNLISAASPSPHGSFKLRFNSIAAAALDSTGELPQGNSFPYGSVIVKDVYNGSDLKLYAVMKKDPSSTNSGGGWLWAEFNPDGSVAFSTGKKGDGCVSCHSGSPNRDLTRTFDLH